MSVKCVVTSVSIEFTKFRMNGAPYRAKGKISLEEVGEKMSRQNPTSGTLEAHRSRTVVAGDSLPLIAYAEYGDPGAWRTIVEANGIDDPLRLRPARAARSRCTTRERPVHDRGEPGARPLRDDRRRPSRRG